MANKDTQDRINALRQEEQLQRNLQTMLNERLTTSGKLTKAQEELSNSCTNLRALLPVPIIRVLNPNLDF